MAEPDSYNEYSSEEYKKFVVDTFHEYYENNPPGSIGLRAAALEINRLDIKYRLEVLDSLPDEPRDMPLKSALKGERIRIENDLRVEKGDPIFYAAYEDFTHRYYLIVNQALDKDGKIRRNLDPLLVLKNVHDLQLEKNFIACQSTLLPPQGSS